MPVADAFAPVPDGNHLTCDARCTVCNVTLYLQCSHPLLQGNGDIKVDIRKEVDICASRPQPATRNPQPANQPSWLI